MKLMGLKSGVVGVACAMALLSSAQAVIINVPGHQPTIQTGIGAANPGDVVIGRSGSILREHQLQQRGGHE